METRDRLPPGQAWIRQLAVTGEKEAAPFTLAHVVGEAHRLIDNVETQVVVNEARMRIDLGVYARPELDRRFEFLRAWEQFLLCACGTDDRAPRDRRGRRRGRKSRR